MNIVIVSSGQPSLNPRLVKEADALSMAGFDVLVIYAYWNHWGTELDKGLLNERKWQAVRAGGDPLSQPIAYLLSRVLFKAARWFAQATGSMTFADIAVARGSFHLRRAAKKYRADLYIGHNLGALPAVVSAAKKNGSPCGFDAEDFHRNEGSDDTTSLAVKLNSYIEDKYIPRLDYLTASSPLIAEAYRRLYPQIPRETILNVFPRNHMPPPQAMNDVLKLFWFSQTIGPGRGIDVVIASLQRLPPGKFELHLLGDCAPDFGRSLADQVRKNGTKIYIHPPIPPDAIIPFAAQFDIGLAAEQSRPLNRDICLTNKLFTYLQAGLAIVASDTSAQRDFLAQFPAIGQLYLQNNVTALTRTLLACANDPCRLAEYRRASAELGKRQLNWENESQKLLGFISCIIPKSLN